MHVIQWHPSLIGPHCKRLIRFMYTFFCTGKAMSTMLFYPFICATPAWQRPKGHTFWPPMDYLTLRRHLAMYAGTFPSVHVKSTNMMWTLTTSLVFLQCHTQSLLCINHKWYNSDKVMEIPSDSTLEGTVWCCRLSSLQVDALSCHIESCSQFFLYGYGGRLLWLLVFLDSRNTKQKQ